MARKQLKQRYIDAAGEGKKLRYHGITLIFFILACRSNDKSNNNSRHAFLCIPHVPKRRRDRSILFGGRDQCHSKCHRKGSVLLCLYVFQERIREHHGWFQYWCFAQSNLGVYGRMGSFANHTAYWLCYHGDSDRWQEQGRVCVDGEYFKWKGEGNKTWMCVYALRLYAHKLSFP